MKYWARLDSNRYIVSVVNDPEPPSPDWVELPANAATGITRTKRKFINGEVVETNESWAPDGTYDLKRVRNYPTIGDQLDMLWHAMDAGQIPKAQQFFNSIKQVKDKYPKP